MHHEPLITTAQAASLRLIADHALEHGWQPADVVHAIKRYDKRYADAAATLVGDHGRRHDAAHRAPHAWVAQLNALGNAAQAELDTLNHADATVLEREARWWPRLEALLPVPSKWGATNIGVGYPRKAPDHDGPVSDKVLATIRALLAKAEATTFEAEAEAFTAKAQQLMSRHSIDTAMLAAAAAAGASVRRGVEARRVHVEHPYANEKAFFLAIIAEVNNVHAIWCSGPGFVTAVGFPVDLQLTNILFTSLLLQATAAANSSHLRAAPQRVAAYRRAFLVAFAHRVAERLREARRVVTADAAQTYGSALAPVLADRHAAVERHVSELFPRLRPWRSRAADVDGWVAGRAAADRADLGAGQALRSAV